MEFNIYENFILASVKFLYFKICISHQLTQQSRSQRVDRGSVGGGQGYTLYNMTFLVTVIAASHAFVLRTGQP